MENLISNNASIQDSPIQNASSASISMDTDAKVPSLFLPTVGENSEVILSRDSDFKLMDSVVVNNQKVRYYYNKTLFLRGSVDNMLEQLEKIHATTYAYLSQLPETGDYSIIGTLFEIIPTISTMIDWGSLNHSCYWDDFCRETKQLMTLLDKVDIAALKCSDTSAYVLNEAQSLFKELVKNDRKPLTIDRAIQFRQAADYINEDTGAQNIQIHWKKPGDVIKLSWHDPDGGLLNVSLNETGIGFRLRFLRHIIYHARSCLESAYATFLRLNVILYLHIPIEKLEKCQNVDLKSLSLQEKAFLIKAKREFDSSLDTVWKMVSRFKYQTFNLLKYKGTFKGMRKSYKYSPKTVPTFVTLKMTVDDSLLMRVMSMGIQAQSKEESFDFTVFPDRTEDIIAIVEDLLAVANPGFKEFQLSLTIIKSTWPQEKDNYTEKEKQSTNDEIKMILAHRFRIRRSLKKAVEVFEKHPVFQKMDKLKLLIPIKQIPKSHDHSITMLQDSSGISESSLEVVDLSSVNDQNNNERNNVIHWITLEGGIKVTFDAMRGVITQCPFTDNVKTFRELSTDEKVILTIRLIRQLLVIVANEQCWAKTCLQRVKETKSLVKRLKQKDRLNPSLQSVILEQNRQIRMMLNLTKSLRFMKKY